MGGKPPWPNRIDRLRAAVGRRVSSRSRRARSKLRENARARQVLLEKLPTGSVGAEIGVWKGDFSAELLERVKPAALHLVDPWAFQPDLPNAWYGGSAAGSQHDMDEIHDGVLARFAEQMAAGRVRVHRATSEQAAGEFAPGELDWVYLDGGHRYEAVRAELELYPRLVRRGGIVGGDDYHGGGWWAGGVK